MFNITFSQFFKQEVISDSLSNSRANSKASVTINPRDEVREKLGDPIFNRFDGVIRFTDLDSEAKIEIARKELDELDEEGTISENIRQNLLVNSTRLENAREIRRLIKDTKSLIEIRKICE